jgi:isoquinoline 1-oxidoreductase alpha subunit
MQFTLTVNKQKQTVDVAKDTPLLWVLRDSLNLLGTKYSCGIGQCGACTVLMDGKPIRSCNYPISELKKQAIVTIEGIREQSRDTLHPIQKVWQEVDVPQCGYCQSGQLLTAIALLEKIPQPTNSDIDQAMTNICRCGTYPEIKAAIHLAAKQQGNVKGAVK